MADMNRRAAAAAARSLSTIRGVPETPVGAAISSGFSTTTLTRTITQTIVKKATRTNTKTVSAATATVTNTVTRLASAAGSIPEFTVPHSFSSRLQPALENTLAAISEPLRHAGSQICNALGSATRHLPADYQLPPEYLALVIAAGYAGAYMGGSVSALLRSRRAPAAVAPQAPAEANARVMQAESPYLWQALNNMANQNRSFRQLLDLANQEAIKLEKIAEENERSGNNQEALGEITEEDVSSTESSLPVRESYIDRVVNDAFQSASPTSSTTSTSREHGSSSHKRRFTDAQGDDEDDNIEESPEPKRRRPSTTPSQTSSPATDKRNTRAANGAANDFDHGEGTRYEPRGRPRNPSSPKRKSTVDHESDDDEETPRQRKKARKSLSSTTSSSGESTTHLSYMTDRQIDARFTQSMTNLEPPSEDEVQDGDARLSPRSGTEMLSHDNNEHGLPIDGTDVGEDGVPTTAEKENGELEQSEEISKNSDSLHNPDDTPTPGPRDSRPRSNLFSTLLPRPKTPDSRKIPVKKDVVLPTAVRTLPNHPLNLSSIPNLAAPTTFRSPKNVSYTARVEQPVADTQASTLETQTPATTARPPQGDEQEATDNLGPLTAAPRTGRGKKPSLVSSTPRRSTRQSVKLRPTLNINELSRASVTPSKQP